MYWKMFSIIAAMKYVNKGQNPSENLQRMIRKVLSAKVAHNLIFAKIERFTKNLSLDNLKDFRELFGMKRDEGSLPLVSVFPAFIDSENFPIFRSSHG
jgi:hypothetical protein